MTSRPQQPSLPIPEQGRARIWCRGPGCHHELTDPESRKRGYGPVCDPDTRNRDPRTARVDQDTIPGT
ncbi:DUF6011 domain-containing protein (plasmid) [Streptomyces platensis]|uniref:DUF6011 domain-containing protein n=1 Tax=Streptomyces platensis TaxID=58346 RepID=UPI002ED140AF|nr:DUF6011 domain-containing protein [Streptomyces platensis]